MIENFLTRHEFSVKLKITAKTAISAFLIILAVALPQFFHIFSGTSGGTVYLPMYLPTLLAGCLLGKWWGLGVGVLSPLASFLFTTLFLSSAMPALSRLPFMMAELAAFGLISGLFSAKIAKNSWMAFPAVLIAEVCGRVLFLVLAAIFQSVSPLNPTLVWTQIQSGLIGLVLWAVIAPILVMLLSLLLKKDGANE